MASKTALKAVQSKDLTVTDNEKIETTATTGVIDKVQTPKFVVSDVMQDSARLFASAVTPFIYGLFLAGSIIQAGVWNIHMITKSKAGDLLGTPKWKIDEWTIEQILGFIDDAVLASDISDKDDVVTLQSSRQNISTGFVYFLTNQALFADVSFTGTAPEIFEALQKADSRGESGRKRIVTDTLAELTKFGNQDIIKGDVSGFKPVNAGEKSRKRYDKLRATKSATDAVAQMRQEAKDGNEPPEDFIPCLKWLKKVSQLKFLKPSVFDNAYSDWVARANTKRTDIKITQKLFMRFARAAIKYAEPKQLDESSLQMLEKAIAEYRQGTPGK